MLYLQVKIVFCCCFCNYCFGNDNNGIGILYTFILHLFLFRVITFFLSYKIKKKSLIVPYSVFSKFIIIIVFNVFMIVSNKQQPNGNGKRKKNSAYGILCFVIIIILHYLYHTCYTWLYLFISFQGLFTKYQVCLFVCLINLIFIMMFFRYIIFSVIQPNECENLPGIFLVCFFLLLSFFFFRVCLRFLFGLVCLAN